MGQIQPLKQCLFANRSCAVASTEQRIKCWQITRRKQHRWPDQKKCWCCSWECGHSFSIFSGLQAQHIYPSQEWLPASWRHGLWPCSDATCSLQHSWCLMTYVQYFTTVYVICLLMFTVLTFYWCSLMPSTLAKMLWNGQHEVVKHFVMFVREQFCDDQRPVWPHSNQTWRSAAL